MNRTVLSTILGLVVLVTSGIVIGGAALPPETTLSGATPSQVEPPSHCLLEKNHGTCVNCCKEATGLSGWICSRYCRNVVPPLPEPQP